MKIIIISILIITSACQNNNNMKIDKNKAYAYQTEEFDKWEQSKKIKLEEAFKIHCEYLKTHDKTLKNTDKYKSYPLSYAYDNYYVFSSVTNIRKIGKFNLSGVWVNADNGEVKFVKIDHEESFSTEGHFWISYIGDC